MEQTRSKQIIILLGILFLIASIMGAYSWSQNNKLTASNQQLNQQVLSLKDTRDGLLDDIDVLQGEFDELLAADKVLKVQLEEANKEVASKKAALKKLQKKYDKDLRWMKAEIKNLRAAKKELTALVDLLRKEREDGGQAEGTLLDSRLGDIDARNKELEEEMARLKQRNSDLDISAIVATNTRVDIRKKGNKPTGSYRRAREIIVSFNLSHLAESKTGVQDLFVVIKDAKGKLVKVANPIMKTIHPFDGGPAEEIIAQQMLTADLFEKVRLQFKVKPEKKSLHKGYYRAFIYADWGLIGKTEFSLR